MTNEDLFTDLKQFITATISQQLANVATKDDLDELRAELKSDINSLRIDLAALDEKIDLVQDAIAETLTDTTKISNTILQDHEKRLVKLERQPA
jgi:DNA anti-recombination protein RmuC